MWVTEWVNMGEEIVTMDERGRITIPKEIRDAMKTKKLKVKLEGQNIVLEPVIEDVDKYYGFFRKDIGDIDVDKVLHESLSESMGYDL
ncbi:AbrB/MazE/SpoVT family DNA-binding domain-containing protein [Metallosphaera tengchongensis]|uniref:AbrB/MazE/SpoVT family DNA-binding domain-containing protein n=1 Tax=Metallosphaera tengchongensis TaxID=1532350 RepID=A0A6N0NZL2_9CREN|nr:AbrB/MazE/SpoVT family DNA-binding domain-containing protein [Metallosphaera tengchongensis]QKR00798.1 AbrB/MazE/SpoVT family DNA-binding domain-containing protein [Metallosphaera tengchongensis]